jgi:glutathione S-transferase
MNELLGAVYSPWTERARWALEVRGVPYRFVPYSPMIGELGLRKKVKRWRGIVSVPVLTTERGEVVEDSVAIARWANGQGKGPALFPEGVARWIDRSNVALDAGRALSLLRVMTEPGAAAEMVPRGIRKLLGPLAGPVGRIGIVRTRRKYGGHKIDEAGHGAALDAVLDELRTALEGRKTILPQFSFADITMAQAIVYVEPPPFGLRLGRASRSAFGDPERRERWADLVKWRDALYEKHRPRHE